MVIYSDTVNILLPDCKGIYSFYPDGATGKTYLARELAKAHVKGYNVYSILYENSNVLETGNKEFADVIMLDRFDMYGSTKLLKSFETRACNSLVLVATKHPDWCDTILGFADILLGNKIIKVVI